MNQVMFRVSVLHTYTSIIQVMFPDFFLINFYLESKTSPLLHLTSKVQSYSLGAG